MFRPTEIESRAPWTAVQHGCAPYPSSGATQTVPMSGLNRRDERLLAVITSDRTRSKCLTFAHQFADRNEVAIHVVTAMSRGAASEIRQKAIGLGADWLCTVAHGGLGLMSLFLDNEDEKIMRAAPCPLVCIPEPLRGGGRPRLKGGALQSIKRILVLMDSARENGNLIPSAVALAVRFGAKVDLLQVDERDLSSLNGVERRVSRALRVAPKRGWAGLAEAMIPVPLRGRKAVRRGLPFFYAATNVAREFRSDLIVLAAPTRVWHAHGRVDFRTERILRSAACAVVCIPDELAITEVDLSAETAANTKHSRWITERPNGKATTDERYELQTSPGISRGGAAAGFVSARSGYLQD